MQHYSVPCMYKCAARSVIWQTVSVSCMEQNTFFSFSFLGMRPNVNIVTSLLSDHGVLKLGCLTVLTELGTILNYSSCCGEASSL